MGPWIALALAFVLPVLLVALLALARTRPASCLCNTDAYGYCRRATRARIGLTPKDRLKIRVS